MFASDTGMPTNPGITPPSTGSGTGGHASSSHLPWAMIPAFRPGETEINEYSRKLEFLAGLWPKEHLALLAPRAAMLCEEVHSKRS